MILKEVLDKAEPFRWCCVKGFDNVQDDVSVMQSVRDPSFVAIGYVGTLVYSLNPDIFNATVFRITSDINVFDSDEPSMLEIWIKHPLYETQEEIQNAKC